MILAKPNRLVKHLVEIIRGNFFFKAEKASSRVCIPHENPMTKFEREEENNKQGREAILVRLPR